KDAGEPVTFRLGEDQELYGQDLKRLTGPHYERSYLPVVQLKYQHNGATCTEESFATVEPQFADHGVVFVQFVVTSKKSEIITSHIEAESPLKPSQGIVRDTNGQALVWFSENSKWNPGEKTLVATLAENESATLAIATKPMASPPEIPLLTSAYEKQQQKCVHTWQDLLDHGTQIEVPEPLVNDAWRALVAGCFTMLKSNSMNYSAGNAYDRLYQAECGDS